MRDAERETVDVRGLGARAGAPEEALEVLARELRGEKSVISPHVRETGEAPALGLLAAAGPLAAGAPGEYALVIETVREGYLLHYAEPRVVVGADHDLALLAGDYLYARGLERLAALGDLEAVRELADLISLSAQLCAEDGNDRGAGALWLASVVAVAAGSSEEHEAAKQALRSERPEGAAGLLAAARSRAAAAGFYDRLRGAADSVGLAVPEDVPDLG